MSEWSADPDLVNRRLKTLVRLLEAKAFLLENGVADPDMVGCLTAAEMRLWAKLNKSYIDYNLKPVKPAKPKETDFSDLIS